MLLAEDGPDNQRLISFILNKFGATVTVVDNGRLAIEALTVNGDVDDDFTEPRPFDVILMDMQMPEMDGYTAAGILRARRYPVPVIALTAHAMAGERDKCIASGCVDYATKPIEKRALLETIHSWMNRETQHQRPSDVAAEPALSDCNYTSRGRK